MTTVAQYLAARLRQLGVEHVFGVPGDFSLALVEALSAPGRLDWVGTANELGAGYAADGYARRRGLGAVCTTFGVGELSVLNAVAGAYAEQVPLVQITGMPAAAALRGGALLHHTLADGDGSHALRAYREFTARAVVLTPDLAALQIDEALQTAIDRLRPVYLGVPADVVDHPVGTVHETRLERTLVAATSAPGPLRAFEDGARCLLAEGGAASARPVLLVGHLVQRLAAAGRLRAVAERGGWPVAHLLSGKGTLDERGPDVAGLYAGTMGPRPVQALVAAARPLITVGAVMTDVVSGFFTHRPDPGNGITLDLDAATVAGRRFEDVRLPDALDVLARLAGEFPAPRPGAEVAAPAGPPPGPAGSTPLGQDELWSALQEWLPAHGTLVTDIGTSFWGAAGITLPDDTVLVSQPVWSSIGYALPATLGAALAEPHRRAVLVIGDGAAQMTAAELGLLARRAPGTVVIVIDNAGYTIERMLRSPQAAYHDVPGWDWPALAAALAPQHPPLTLTLRTRQELVAGLRRAGAESGRLTLLHAVVEPGQAPPLLHALADAVTGR